MTNARRWQDLSQPVRSVIVLGAIVQLILVSVAHADLTRRPDAQVRGSKRMWRWITLVNFLGPLTYFWVGREPDAR